MAVQGGRCRVERGTAQRSFAFQVCVDSGRTCLFLVFLFAQRTQLAGECRYRFAYTLGMGEMRRARAREEAERANRDRIASTLVIAAACVLHP